MIKKIIGKEFLDAKEKAIKSLEKACDENKADKEILPILTLINQVKGCYTTSSCSGRIVILEIPQIGDKQKASFLGKWHRKVDLKEIQTALQKVKKGYVWFIAQSPIIHIVTDEIETADRILKIALGCGFKNSGLKSIRRKIVIEICSTERLDAPIGLNGFIYNEDNYLQILVDISNDILEKSKGKLARFKGKLIEIVG